MEITVHGDRNSFNCVRRANILSDIFTFYFAPISLLLKTFLLSLKSVDNFLAR